jgi:hypothetical protein
MATTSTPSFLDIVIPTVEYGDFIHQPAANPPPRPASIAGKTIALIPNWKAISAPFLDVFARRLNAGTDIKHAFMHNPDWQFTHPERIAKIGPEIDKLAGQCDLMVSGVAD